MQRREIIKEDDVIDALEEIQMEKVARGSSLESFGQTAVPKDVRESIAVYEAGTALIGFITPNYDELQKVCCTVNAWNNGGAGHGFPKLMLLHFVWTSRRLRVQDIVDVGYCPCGGWIGALRCVVN